jgi:hypothetical protein
MIEQVEQLGLRPENQKLTKIRQIQERAERSPHAKPGR